MSARDETPSDPGEQRVFTTGEAAALCKVSQQTIIRCFDSGRLGGFRVPGSRFRRIPREELLRFMRANGIPTDALDRATRRRVLVVDDQPQSALADALARDGRFEVRRAATAYEAGLLTAEFRPHVLVLCGCPEGLSPGEVLRARSRQELSAMKLAVVSAAPQWTHAGVDAVIDSSATPSLVVERLARLAEMSTGTERTHA
jgi:excisionase family DNA binding protein